ncbi:MAG TPA: asparaginase domain-containing protein [Sphingopyxis sp.]|nr:asparaginase domain-containing protein [Sphingopyxis sp.]
MIDIFTTGGTIDKVYFDALSEFQIGPTSLNQILTDNGVHIAHRVTELLRKDSLDMDEADRQSIFDAVLASDAERILITHGTDTMVQTGRLLSRISGKTIVMTGAMQPFRVRGSDAEFNVGFALAAVQTLPAGVYVAMNGTIFDPLKAEKDRAGARFVVRD